MPTELQNAEREKLIEQSTRHDETPFDYIIVGSGAGGGPLAARLALNDRKVLLIEAGPDIASAGGQVPEVYKVPAYNGAATEDDLTSWNFSVRHYDDVVRQRADAKYDASKDPSQTGGRGKGGIFYPRAAALGGCTSHHAMIIIRPNDSDWDEIAKTTGDESWRSENMQGYFPKIEKCLYYAVYKGFFGKILGLLLYAVQWVAALINPRRELDPSGHGFKGWQPTSFIDPLVVAGIARRDRTLLGLLINVAWSALASREKFSLLKRAVTRLQIVQFLDPNVRADFIPTRERLSLISIGTDGRRRSGVREWLLDVAGRHPDRLVILTGAHVTRIIFDKAGDCPAPQAVGVEVAHGDFLYKASKRCKPGAPRRTRQYFAKGEIIVSGGSFNSPQLLMLSGIGDAARLADVGVTGLRNSAGGVVAPVVHLPGVGSNLQDRYEVSVVSEMKRDFSTLNKASFRPGDDDDPMRRQWLADGTGLYGTNGGALAMMASSSTNPRKERPDLFIFGVPAAFRGYYWKWSEELLRRTKGALADQRNLWTWVILKAYTKNNAGTVGLLSDDPFDVPEINFRSFPKGPTDPDLDALSYGVQRVREFNAQITGMKLEVQPGPDLPDRSPELVKWIQDEAWGHHACGTCRIGSDPWRPKPADLEDKNAVLDSKFRVHGVSCLRVVDASVFPTIPGYFIVTPVFMIGEKAADEILADSAAYPAVLEKAEAAAVHRRRQEIGAVKDNDPPPPKLQEDCIGLALSGGGIRSATYCLGMLQALAGVRILRNVDFLSTVSGGGYIGGFLGRLYTRQSDVRDKAGRVEAILGEARSPEIWWLRQHANYIGGAGRSDLETNLAVVARNLASVLFCVAALFLGVLGALRWISDGVSYDGALNWTVAGLPVTPWWQVSAALLFAAVLPLAIGYWLTPSTRSKWPYSVFGVLAWAVLLACAVAAIGVPALWGVGLIATGVLLLAWLWLEIVRVGSPSGDDNDNGVDDATQKRRGGFATLYRNRLARTLGSFLLIFTASVAFVVIDTLARAAAQEPIIPAIGGALLIVAPLVPVVRAFLVKVVPGRLVGSVGQLGISPGEIVFAVIAFALAVLLFFAIDAVAHAAFNRGHAIGVWVVLAALATSVALGSAMRFLNLSSLQQVLAQKLARTFLGASNDSRVRPGGIDAPVPVNVASEDDDLMLSGYHPERHGGPLHLLNVCINETVDQVSGRQLVENKGLPMCLGPGGISVGRYHALWEQYRDPSLPADRVEVCALPVAPDPHAFHVLARSDGEKPAVEQLSLGHWMAISAAAWTTGSGRKSSLPLSLLLGLFNVRLGYWWDSGIPAGRRPGRYPPNLWRRIKSLPSTVFAVQAMLLNEWRGHFTGPSARRWYLSDGGHFDNTGIYELVRRRLPFIIAVDATQDARNDLDDMAVLMRQVRLDFGTELEWLDLDPSSKADDWPPMNIPHGIRDRLLENRHLIGGLDQIGSKGKCCAALARIKYPSGQDRCGRQMSADGWLLLIKANLAPPIRADVRTYAKTNENFPNQSTVDQFFDDAQWESYRSLGESAGKALFGAGEDGARRDGPARAEALTG